ncbi:unnamed protein product [Meloidogyne enterolobii]|uniref:Uncharacterized protein n=1 Tax=Meloidogyne enterolobii TaxID=390850 RepID=A0ACB1A0C8_MELEN
MESQENENSKRRISKPRVQYSPVTEAKRSYTKKTKQKFSVKRLNSLFNDSSSTYSTRESSVDEFFGYDVLSQFDLSNQLVSMKQIDFVLPPYPDLRDAQELNLGVAEHIENFLDEQEEIKLLESNLFENDHVVEQMEITQAEAVEHMEIEGILFVKVYFPSIAFSIPSGRLLIEFSGTVLHNLVTLFTVIHSKLKGNTEAYRPHFFLPNFPLYFYKMVRLFPFFHPICLPNFCLQSNKKDYLILYKGKYMQKTSKSRKKGKSLTILKKYNWGGNASVLPIKICFHQEPPAEESASSSQQPYIEPTNSTSFPVESVGQISPSKLERPPYHSKLKLKIKLPRKPNTVQTAIDKRTRRPTKFSEDFVFTPLVMQRKSNDALKIKQKAIIKQQESKAERKRL